uniref:Uncharacterized protein n=1 Tax=Timema shepardi TaxID=629360 RepID=A0A7R9ASM7_TIMSH|nr:unnamed protein product [Timema shepardi]
MARWNKMSLGGKASRMFSSAHAEKTLRTYAHNKSSLVGWLADLSQIPQLPAACDVAAGGRRGLPLADDNSERDYCADAAVAALTGNLDPSVLAAMDKDALKKQIENMKYQATMERWPLSKSIAA